MRALHIVKNTSWLTYWWQTPRGQTRWKRQRAAQSCLMHALMVVSSSLKAKTRYKQDAKAIDLIAYLHGGRYRTPFNGGYRIDVDFHPDHRNSSVIRPLQKWRIYFLGKVIKHRSLSFARYEEQMHRICKDWFPLGVRREAKVRWSRWNFVPVLRKDMRTKISGWKHRRMSLSQLPCIRKGCFWWILFWKTCKVSETRQLTGSLALIETCRNGVSSGLVQGCTNCKVMPQMTSALCATCHLSANNRKSLRELSQTSKEFKNCELVRYIRLDTSVADYYFIRSKKFPRTMETSRTPSSYDR